MVASDISALKAVIDVDKERIALEKWAEELATRDDDGIFLTLFYIGYNYKIKQYGLCKVWSLNFSDKSKKSDTRQIQTCIIYYS